MTLAALTCTGAAVAALVTVEPGALAQAAPDTITSSVATSDANQSTIGEVRFSLTDRQAAMAHSASLMPRETRSILNVPRSFGHGDYVWDEEGVEDGPMAIWVDLRRQMISVYRNGHEIGTAVIVYGSPEKETPLGKFPILSKYRDYHSRSYDSPMPYSMFVTTDGVALHGSPINRTRATRGCVGLPIAFARKLFAASKKGEFVQIVRSDEPSTDVAYSGF